MACQFQNWAQFTSDSVRRRAAELQPQDIGFSGMCSAIHSQPQTLLLTRRHERSDHKLGVASDCTKSRCHGVRDYTKEHAGREAAGVEFVADGYGDVSFLGAETSPIEPSANLPFSTVGSVPRCRRTSSATTTPTRTGLSQAYSAPRQGSLRQRRSRRGSTNRMRRFFSQGTLGVTSRGKIRPRGSGGVELRPATAAPVRLQPKNVSPISRNPPATIAQVTLGSRSSMESSRFVHAEQLRVRDEPQYWPEASKAKNDTDEGQAESVANTWLEKHRTPGGDRAVETFRRVDIAAENVRRLDVPYRFSLVDSHG